MSDSDALAAVRELFREETEELLREMTNLLLDLESGSGEGPEASLHALFRKAHGIKGAAASVGMREIEELTHAMEDVLGAMRTKHVAYSRAVGDALFMAIEGVSSLLAGQPIARDAVIAELRRSTAGVGDAAGSVPTTTAAAPTEAAPVEAASAPGWLRVGEEQLERLLDHTADVVIVRARTQERTRQLRDVLQLFEQQLFELALLAESQRVAPQQLAGLVTSGRSAVRSLRRLGDQLSSDAAQLGMAAQAIEPVARRVRSESFGSLAPLLQRTVRAAGAAAGKPVELALEGEATAVEKKLLDRLAEPLVHILRNAVDHGIEPPEARRRAGKPDIGRIAVRATLESSELHLVVEDDGAGIDAEAVRAAAVTRGLLDDAAARAATREHLHQILMQPGFSTRTSVSTLSGRGVGLDAAGAAVAALRGEVRIDSRPGAGARFELVVPVRSMAQSALILRVGGQTIGVPFASVERTFRLDAADLGTVEGKAIVRAPGGAVAFAALGELFGHAEASPQVGVMLRSARERFVVGVDAVLRDEELLVRPLPSPLDGVTVVVGAALCGDGTTVVVLDPEGLRSVVWQEAAVRAPGRAQRTAGQRCVLLADDSNTSRMMETLVLEGGGFQVQSVVDGRKALERLRAQPERFLALVSDVEMPELDGISLCAQLRADPALRALPVILLTSLDDPEQRRRGLEAGASAYLTKQTFDPEMLLGLLRKLSHS